MEKSGVKVSPVNLNERAGLELRAGDTVRVWQKIEEIKSQKNANKKVVATKNVRRQAFEGIILAVKHGTEAGATFTVRRVASGVGVERIFPLYTPTIESIEILRRGKMRRAKLYFIRRKAARDVKRQMRKSTIASTPVFKEEAVEAPTEASQETPVAAE
ncbi:MAG: 50S ribosomal protein L19 [Patescibacteria group bacterium]